MQNNNGSANKECKGLIRPSVFGNSFTATRGLNPYSVGTTAIPIGCFCHRQISYIVCLRFIDVGCSKPNYGYTHTATNKIRDGSPLKYVACSMIFNLNI